MLFNVNGYGASGDSLEVSTESLCYITEAILMEGLSSDEMEDFLESYRDVNTAVSEGIVQEKTIIKLDKKAKLSKAQKAAIYTVAREKKDKDFIKLLKVWRMERLLKGKLRKKYTNEAARRAKKAMSKAGSSKSNMVKKAAAAAKKQFNASGKPKK
jgi:hypothetical protein